MDPRAVNGKKRPNGRPKPGETAELNGVKVSKAQEFASSGPVVKVATTGVR